MDPAQHVFISYANADPPEYVEAVQRQLRVALKSLAGFEIWSDDRIEIAEDWGREIHRALARSACAILLISPRFLDSDYICDQELPELLCRAKSEPLGVIPLFVSGVPKRALKFSFSCQGKTEDFDLASLAGANGPDRPLETLPEPEQNDLLVRLADKVAE